MTNLDTIYTLKMILKGIDEPLSINVGKDDYERLSVNLDDQYFDSQTSKFFSCSTLDGKLYSINLNHVQFVHYLWSNSELPTQAPQYEGPIQICLLNQSRVIEISSDSAEEVYDFLSELETYNGETFKGFTDTNDQYLSFQVNEIVYVLTPEDLYEEGFQIAMEKDNLI